MTNSYENNRVEELKVFLSPHFSRFNELGVYYWISGGAILSFFTGQEPNSLLNYQIYTGKVFRSDMDRMTEYEPSVFYQRYDSDARSSSWKIKKTRI